MDETETGAASSARGHARSSCDDAQGQGLSDHTQKRIGLHLRAMYDTIVQQPVPDRFRDLIAKLDSAAFDDDKSLADKNA